MIPCQGLRISGFRHTAQMTKFINKALGELRLISINIDSIRDKKLDILTLPVVHQTYVLAIQGNGNS